MASGRDKPHKASARALNSRIRPAGETQTMALGAFLMIASKVLQARRRACSALWRIMVWRILLAKWRHASGVPVRTASSTWGGWRRRCSAASWRRAITADSGLRSLRALIQSGSAAFSCVQSKPTASNRSFCIRLIAPSEDGRHLTSNFIPFLWDLSICAARRRRLSS